MHALLSLRMTLLRAAITSATSSRRWHAASQLCCGQRQPAPQFLAGSSSGAGGRPARLHAVAPLLEQPGGASAASLSEEVCSNKCRVFDVPGDVAEDIADVLMAYGAQSVSIEEFRATGAPEQEIFVADNSAAEKLWDRCTVVAYFAPEADAEAILEVVKGDCGLDHHQQSVEPVRAQDWEESIRAGLGPLGLAAGSGGGSGRGSVAAFAAWHSMQSAAANTAALRIYKESYQPTEVEPGLWIVPVWTSAPDPTATNIVLEPGLAFGTGDHPTTRLCLRWLRRLPGLAGARLMDYGTGSGVLAVAALLMGAQEAAGTDIEPLSIKAAAANAVHNRVGEKLRVFQCSPSLEEGEPLADAGVPPQERQFDVVVSNILKGPLLSLAPRLAAYAKPGAALGLSGVLKEQAPAVIQAYSPFFEDFEVEGEDAWALVTARRKAGLF